MDYQWPTCQNPLVVFDFDDTLIRSHQKVHVRHGDGTYTSLTSHEFARYELQPDDTTDFSAFEKRLADVDVLPCWDLFLYAIDTWGPDSVCILTARTDPRPIQKWLSWMGAPPVHVQTGAKIVGNSKAGWIREQLAGSHYDALVYFEDNELWLSDVNHLSFEFPDVAIITNWIRDGIITYGYEEHRKAQTA